MNLGTFRKRIGPLEESDAQVGQTCPACSWLFAPGDVLTFVPLGPGRNAAARRAAIEGRPFPAVAALLHFECAMPTPTEIEIVGDTLHIARHHNPQGGAR